MFIVIINVQIYTWEFADKHSLESGPPQLRQNILVFGGLSHISQKHLNTKTITNVNINITHFTISLCIFLADWRVHIWYL